MSDQSLILKVNADKGNTVLFRTSDTGGSLEISIDGEVWYGIGVTELDNLDLGYTFISPLKKSLASNEVSLSYALSDNVGGGESLRAVLVGSSGVIGYNLLPRIVGDLKSALDDTGLIKKDILPSDISYVVWEDYT